MLACLYRAFGCLASGLAHIHSKKVKHKDVKPKNVLIHRGGVLYSDFGASKNVGPGDTTTQGPVDAQTRKYSPPEILANSERSYSRDVWSLGCVYIEILAVISLLPSVDVSACFSASMQDIHNELMAEHDELPPKLLLLLPLVVSMTAQKRKEKPSADQLTSSIATTPKLACVRCQRDISSEAKEPESSGHKHYEVEGDPTNGVNESNVGLISERRSTPPKHTSASAFDPLLTSRHKETERNVTSSVDKRVHERWIEKVSTPSNHTSEASRKCSITPWVWSAAHGRCYSYRLSPEGDILEIYWEDPGNRLPISMAANPEDHTNWMNECPVTDSMKSSSKSVQGNSSNNKDHDSDYKSYPSPIISRLSLSDLPRESQSYIGLDRRYVQTGTDPNIEEALDARFRRVVTYAHSQFFVLGRVFKMLWKEGPNLKTPGRTRNSTHFSTVSLGEGASSEIRYFVVLRNHGQHSVCVPIQTYGGRGATKAGLVMSDHSVIHTSSTIPGPLREEHLTKYSIRVEPEGENTLARESRVNYGKACIVQHNVKSAMLVSS